MPLRQAASTISVQLPQKDISQEQSADESLSQPVLYFEVCIFAELKYRMCSWLDNNGMPRLLSTQTVQSSYPDDSTRGCLESSGRIQ